MKKQLAALLIVSIFFSSACKKNDEKSSISSGRIDYKITYLNTDLDKKTLGILPKKMRLTFNEKHAANNIDGFMGMYKLNAFTNFHSRKCSTVLKILDKHYVFKGSRDEEMCCFDTMDDMEIEETNETKIIAGFNCQKAIITLPSSNESFVIYYTNEINLRHPNATNPYKNIKGVLMEFELKLLYIKMRFEAEKFQSVSDIDFAPKINDNCKSVSRSQMTQILNKLME